MIRITKKGDYAVFIMGCLAQRTVPARRGDGVTEGRNGDQETVADRIEGKELKDTQAVCSAQEIAETTHLSKSLVANLLKDLTRAELLESVRGLRGGYRLARPAASISLAAILQAVEGPFQLVDCASTGNDKTSHPILTSPSHDCSYSKFCPTRSPMRTLHARIHKMLEDVKLPELVGIPLSHRPAKVAASDPQFT